MQNTYVQGLYDGLSAALRPRVAVEIVDSYSINDHDFRASVAKLRSQKYDAVGVFLISGQVSEFYRQMMDQGISLPTFGTDFFESSTEIALAGGAMEGAVYPHLGVTDAFRKAYVSRFGNDYQIAYAGNAYDMAVLIAALFGTADRRPGADEIMQKLRASGERDGVGGHFHYRDTDEGGPHFEYPVQLKRIKDGKVEAISQ